MNEKNTKRQKQTPELELAYSQHKELFAQELERAFGNGEKRLYEIEQQLEEKFDGKVKLEHVREELTLAMEHEATLYFIEEEIEKKLERTLHNLEEAKAKFFFISLGVCRIIASGFLFVSLTDKDTQKGFQGLSIGCAPVFATFIGANLIITVRKYEILAEKKVRKYLAIKKYKHHMDLWKYSQQD